MSLQKILEDYGIAIDNQGIWIGLMDRMPNSLKQELLYVLSEFGAEIAVDYANNINNTLNQEIGRKRTLLRKINDNISDNLLWDSPGFDEANKIMKVSIFNLVYKPQQEKGKQCPACKSDDTSVYMVQLRSADEAASTLTFCNACGKRDRTN